MKITCGIPTKNRYDVLSHTLLSIAFQTYKPQEIIIVDDSDNPIDIRTIPTYLYILKLFDDFKIKWKVLFGAKKGQHYSHQLVQEQALGEYIFRVDDDVILEPNVLLSLLHCIHGCKEFGAVAPLVLMPNSTSLPKDIRNKITNLNIPNVQWFNYNNEINNDIAYQDVDHLYSTFLYRKDITNYELSLSPVAHREETIFSYKIKRAGYKLNIDPAAKCYHFRQETGGIRSYQNLTYYEHDEKIFKSLLHIWNVDSSNVKSIVLKNGIGDHFAFKHILNKLKSKYEKLILYVTFPEVFFDIENLELKSIAEAELLFGNVENFNIYKWMWDNNWKGNLVEAFEKFYL